MAIFSEEWLTQHQSKIAALKRAASVSHVTNAELLQIYKECGSVWRTAQSVGLSGQRVQQRLRPILGPGLDGSRPWTPDEDVRLREDYAIYAGSGTLGELAQDMGRTKQFICRKAKALGLTERARAKPWARGGSLKGVAARFSELHATASDLDLAETFNVSRTAIVRWRALLGLRKDPKEKWNVNPHPRGATGMRHTPETIATLSRHSRARWADPQNPLNGEAHRQRLSDRMSKLQRSGVMRASYSRGSMGRRPDLGDIFFRSSWEANYARYLNFLIAKGEIARWEYEPDTFWFIPIKRGIRSYMPDFKVWERETAQPYYVEIKGWMDAKSKTKLKRMQKYHPAVKIRLLDQVQYKALAKSVAGLLPHWEHGGRRPRSAHTTIAA